MGAIIAVPVTVAVLAPSFETDQGIPVDIGPTTLYPKVGQGQIPWHAVTFENRPDDTTGLVAAPRLHPQRRQRQVHRHREHLHAPRLPGAGQRDGLRVPVPRRPVRQEGRRIAGPPVRPLNRYETTIDDKGHLILGQLYAMDDSLHRHQLKGPGQPVKGLLSYLYPAAPQG